VRGYTCYFERREFVRYLFAVHCEDRESLLQHAILGQAHLLCLTELCGTYGHFTSCTFPPNLMHCTYYQRAQLYITKWAQISWMKITLAHQRTTT
jgi:hypothetical protein